MSLRRLTVTVFSTVAVLTAAPAASAVPEPPIVPPAYQDQLTVTVTGTADAARNGTYTLDCHPAGGTHRNAAAACTRLDELTRWGSSPFAPIPPDANCTMAYGGPATAHLTGSWAGRSVDAHFNRADGCEMSRWRNLEPVLPVSGR